MAYAREVDYGEGKTETERLEADDRPKVKVVLYCGAEGGRGDLAQPLLAEHGQARCHGMLPRCDWRAAIECGDRRCAVAGREAGEDGDLAPVEQATAKTAMSFGVNQRPVPQTVSGERSDAFS